MADEEKKKGEKSKKIGKEKIKTDESLIQQLKISYRMLEDRKKFYRTTLFPLIGMGVMMFCMPIILKIAVPFPLEIDPITFIIGGIVPIFLGISFPSFLTIGRIEESGFPS